MCGGKRRRDLYETVIREYSWLPLIIPWSVASDVSREGSRSS